MSVFIVTATYTDDDYKRPHSDSLTAMAASYEDAVIHAVEFYLQSLGEGYAFVHRNPSEFRKIIEQHRSNSQALFSALYSYFQRDPEGLFTGEFVPETLSVTIDESERVPVDETPILSMVDEIVRYIKEEIEEA